MSKGEVGGSRMANVLKATEDLTKTPEQLEEEKKAKLAERIPKLNLDGKTKDQLVEIVEKWFAQLSSTTFYIYELGEKQQRQKYDVIFIYFKLLNLIQDYVKNNYIDC